MVASRERLALSPPSQPWLPMPMPQVADIQALTGLPCPMCPCVLVSFWCCGVTSERPGHLSSSASSSPRVDLPCPSGHRGWALLPSGLTILCLKLVQVQRQSPVLGNQDLSPLIWPCRAPAGSSRLRRIPRPVSPGPSSVTQEA